MAGWMLSTGLWFFGSIAVCSFDLGQGHCTILWAIETHGNVNVLIYRNAKSLCFLEIPLFLGRTVNSNHFILGTWRILTSLASLPLVHKVCFSHPCWNGL